MNDRELSEIIESCRRGDREAFRSLYEAYKDKVYSVALYFFHGDAAAACDATQQAFLKVMTSISQFRSYSGFSTWLYRLVVNTCLDGTRRGKPKVVELSGAVLNGLVRSDPHPDDLERAEIASSIQAAVSALPPRFRVAVLLRYFDDLSYEQMAKALNCSMGTVASRLSRGHSLLARKLAGLGRPRGKASTK